MKIRDNGNDPAFDADIGALDFILSRMMMHRADAGAGRLSEANRQTLKHHAEDMSGCAECILRTLGLEDVPQAAGEGEAPLPEGDSDADRVYYALYNAWAASPMDTPQEEFYHHARNAFQRLRALLGASAPDPDLMGRLERQAARILDMERRIERAVASAELGLGALSWADVLMYHHAALAALQGEP